MAKIGRNASCPCGSERKYKKCCGDPLKHQSGEGNSHLFRLPKDLELAIKRHKARELIRTQQQGMGRPIIATNIAEYQVVAVGNTIHYSKNWRFFSDFLTDFIKNALGGEWGNAEIAKPLEQRHPILQWYDALCRFQRSNEKQPDGAYVAIATGVVYCYLGLAYNLYLLKHNVELQKRLVARLKNREQFQGAYYELFVVNSLIRAGFELTLEDETDESSKHCEFSAVSKNTGKKYWVEAKMRSISGFLGKTNLDGGKPTSKPTSMLTKHLRGALRKPAQDERLIFIDVNTSPLEKSDLASSHAEMPEWMQAAAQQLDQSERDSKASQPAYVFVTNIPFHRGLEEEALGHSVLVHGLGIPDFGKPGQYRLSEIWRQKQKHIDAHNIMEAIKSYPKIPTTFDGTLSLTKYEADNRIQIGQIYFFNDIGDKGLLGEVVEATLSEGTRTIHFIVKTEDGQHQILYRDITDEELASYKQHPDAYFGVIKQVTKRRDDPYELFEWMVDCYKETPKEKLLEFCKDHPDANSLAELNHEDLMLTICERWTASVVATEKNKNDSAQHQKPKA